MALAFASVAVFPQPPTSQPTTAPVVVDQPSSGWRLRFPPGWLPPKPYNGKDVIEVWDRQGIGHRVPPGADTEVFLGPMLLWWGDEIREGQTIQDVVKLAADHHGYSKELTMGDVVDVVAAGLPAKRVEVTFSRSIAFAPPGKGHGRMRAVLFLIREKNQENAIWFEAPEAGFAQYEKDVTSIAQDA